MTINYMPCIHKSIIVYINFVHKKTIWPTGTLATFMYTFIFWLLFLRNYLLACIPHLYNKYMLPYTEKYILHCTCPLYIMYNKLNLVYMPIYLHSTTQCVRIKISSLDILLFFVFNLSRHVFCTYVERISLLWMLH